ncbi:MAG: hypothetical protein OXC95_06735 [Dehalococcoidia bacterium]|nr:hypothetical protein [Dehalococcoidia bacterium]
MNTHDLLRVAYQLALEPGIGRPRQVNLRRAISTAYYVLFHALANCCADMLAGSTRASRSQHAWRQTYRALEHRFAKNQCVNQSVMSRFLPDIQGFGEVFATMQGLRHVADYDPYLDRSYTRAGALQRIEESEQAIHEFESAAAGDRRALAIYALLRLRSG